MMEAKGWHSLPVEIHQGIISKAINNDDVTKMVCRFVSKEWKAITPAVSLLSKVPTRFTSLVALSGHLNQLEWAKKNGAPISEDTIAAAAGGGHLHILKYLINEGCPANERAANLAAKGDDVGLSWNSQTVGRAAAQGGRLNVLQWLEEIGVSVTNYTFFAIDAAAANQFEVVKWAVTKGCKLRNESLCSFAAGAGNLEVLKWLVDEQRFTLQSDALNCALWGGHLDVLEWLKDRNPPQGFIAWIALASKEGGGQKTIQLLDWANKNGYIKREDFLSLASGAMRVDVLDWVKAHGYTLQSDLWSWAIKAGNISVLNYLKNEGIAPPLFSSLPHLAANAGQVEALKWLRDAMGQPIEEFEPTLELAQGDSALEGWVLRMVTTHAPLTCRDVIANGEPLRLVRWVKEKGHPLLKEEDLEDMFEDEWEPQDNLYLALQTLHDSSDEFVFDLNLLKWIHRESKGSYTLCSSHFDLAACAGYLEILKWMKEIGCPWSANTCASAAECGHLEALKWLRENGCPWDENTGLRARPSFKEVADWAIQNGCPSAPSDDF